MDALIYFLKANLVFVVLLGAYLLLLRRETWYAARRFWLLASALLAITLPLLPSGHLATTVMTIHLPEVGISNSASPGAHNTDWLRIATVAHLAITTVLLIMLIARCVTAFRAVASASNEARSFFQQIHIPASATEQDHVALMAHEHAHASRGHSFDVLLFEAAAALFWSNPAWRLALRELRLVHELEADSIARMSHPHYEALLLAQAFGVPTASLLNSFGSNNLKLRMTMLKNTRSPRLARRKLLLGFPLLAFAVALSSWQAAPATIAPAPEAKTFPGIDQQPEFPGGQEALIKYIGANLTYPASAKSDRVEGKVFVVFTVKSNGQVADASVKRGVREDIDNEALRVVRSMPAWKPAQSGGKAVSAQMTLPIAFKLE
ncbi:MAG: TonB family protein [Flavobacteriales bacterium]|nr:TonB family protein [Flavobacteriales bacterium]